MQHTDPHQPDTDNDGLLDGAEVEIYFTDPLNPDSDGDGFMDGLEVAWGANPLDPKNSLLNTFFNLIGLGFLISAGYFVTRTTLVSKKQKSKLKSLKPKLSIDKENTYNAVKVEKKDKPKPFVKPAYKPTYTPRPSYPYAKSIALMSPAEINRLRNTILYELPPPKNPYSQEGKQATAIANLAMNDFSRGDLLNFSKHLTQALMMGVPEPMNSSLKAIILDVLTKMSREVSQGQVRPQPTRATPQQPSRDEPQISTEIKYCGYCGKKNTRTNKFCAFCGRAFD
ncbi:MAG: hypothetical protein EU542_02810 [Promethearchaeota archaeon]|nr:MAG: hypothetical protein EU542_02810 [Candidatus Lokiarchaeota archaeon]